MIAFVARIFSPFSYWKYYPDNSIVVFMSIRKLAGLIGVLYFLSVLLSCNDGVSLLPPAVGTYNVSATVNSRSLNEYPIVKEHDKISPHFTNFDANDPDIRSLVIFLQTSNGVTLDGTIRYSLSESAIRKNQASDSDAVPDDDKMPETPETETPAEENPTVESPVKESPFIESPFIESPVVESPLVESPVEETPSAQKTQGRGVTDRIFLVEHLDKDLPEFEIAPSLEVGRYLMVFQVRGEKHVLYQMERAFYFIADAEFTFHGVWRYLPSPSSIGHLAPPAIPIMLEARLDFDPRLKPYIVWYNGKKRIGEERPIGEGGRFIWTVPRQTGFQNIRAEIFPFTPIPNTNGERRELSLAVSSESKIQGYFSKKNASINVSPSESSRSLANNNEEFRFWYQFQNNLADTLFPDDRLRDLRPLGSTGTEPYWLPAGELYGLALGPNDRYELPVAPFSLAQGEAGVGQFLFHVKPLGNGTVFRALFDTKEALGGMVALQLVFIDDTALLRVSKSNETIAERPFSTSKFQNEDLITVLLNIGFNGKELSASIALEEDGAETKPVTVIFKEPLNGRGSFYLGAISQGKTTDTPTAILDELAVSFTFKPLSFEEPDETDEETVAAAQSEPALYDLPLEVIE
jgi:hypothetical protein